MIIHSRPLLKYALNNLFVQHTQQAKGGNFMYNYQFDPVISNKAQQVIETPASEHESLQVITELDPNKKEQIINVGRDS